MTEIRNVAIVGASGIGKHHANWWHTEGARVCAFVGTSPQSIAQTREVLQDLFGFDGRGYATLEELIAEQAPHIVDICSPPRYHYAHAMTAIDAGCDVLCEKPFIYEEGVPADELLDQARTVVAEAGAAGVRLGMCSQYHVSARFCRAFLAEHTGQETVETYGGQLASPAAGRRPDPASTWVDLSPHMLAGLQALLPGARIDFTSLSTEFSGHDAGARFEVQLPDGARVECEVRTGRTTGESDIPHVRRFELNGSVFDIGGESDENGVYCAQYRTPWGTFRREDPMRLLIREFLSGKNPIDGPTALTNLSWLLRIKKKRS